MPSIGVVEGTLRLKDEFTSRLKVASAQLEQTGKRMENVGRKMSAAGAGLTKAVTLPLLAIGGAAVKSFGDFDDAMTKSLAIMGKVDDAMRNKMTSAAREVAKTTTFSAKQAAESYFFLASAGLDAATSVASLPQVSKFAQAGAFDMALATDLLTDAQSALGLTIRDDVVKQMENMARVSDVLVKANTLANATVEQFSTSLTTEAGAALKSFNIDVEEGVAVLAAFADQGVKSEVAGTGLSRILRLATSAAVKHADAYERLGITVFDAGGNIANLADIVRDLENALGGMSDEQRVVALESLGFQARVQGVILPLLGTSEAIRRYEKELRNAAGTTEEVANNQLKSLWAQLGLVKDRFIDAFITLGKSVAPTLQSFGQNVLIPLADAIGSLAEKFGQLPGPVKSAAVAFAALAAAAGPVLFVAGGLVTGLGAFAMFAPQAAGAFAIIGTKLAAFGAIAKWVLALFKGPVGWIATGVALLLAWKPVRDILFDLGRQAFGVLAEWLGRARAKLEEFWRSTAEARKWLADLARVVGDMLARALKVYVGAQIEFLKALGRAAALVAEYSGLLYVLETVILNVSRAIEVQIGFFSWLGGVIWEVIGGYEGLKAILLVLSPLLGLALVQKDLESDIAGIARSTQEAAGAILSLRAAVDAGGGITSQEVYDRAINAQETLLQRITDTGVAITKAKAAGAASSVVAALEQERALYEGQVAVLGRVLEAVKGVAKAKVDAAGGGGGGLTPESEEMAAFRGAVEASMRALRGIADAWAVSAVAGREAVRQAELEASILERTKELKGAELAIAQQMLRAEDQLMRIATGAERIATLSEEKTFLEGQLRALEEGANAVAEAEQAWEAWKREIEATAGVAEDQRDAIADLDKVVDRLQRRLKIRAENKALGTELNQLKALHDEYARGPAAVAKLQKAQELENKVRQGTIGLVGLERATRATLIVMLERQKAANDALAGDQAKLQEIAGMQRLLDVYERGAATVQELEEAIRLANLETAIQNQLWSEGVDAESPRGREIIALATAYSELSAKLAKARADAEAAAADFEQIWKNAAKNMQKAFGDAIANFFTKGERDFKSFFEMIANIGANALSEGLSAAITAALQGHKGAFKELGQIFAGGQGTILAGLNIATNIANAQNEGYAAAGAAIGFIVGGIAGAGAWSWLGAKWGAVIGSTIGGLIKKGAPEFHGALVGELGKIDVEGSIARAAPSLAKDIQRGVEQVLDAIGGELVGIAEGITFKMRKGLQVIVDGVARYFDENSIAEGVQFAIVEALKRADVTGISAEARTVLNKTVAETMDALISDLDFAKFIEQLGMDDAAKQLDDFVTEFFRVWKRAGDLGLDASERLTQWAAQQLQSQRNAILGIQESEAERIRRQAEAFNAQILLIRAEQEARRVELMTRRIALEADVKLVEAEGGLLRAHTEIRKGFLTVEGEFVRAEGEILKAQIGLLSATVAALEAIDALLASLPDLISNEEIDAAIRRSGGGGKGKRKQDLEQLNDMLAAAALQFLPEMSRSIDAVNEKWDAAIPLAHKNAAKLNEIAAARERELQALRDQLREQVTPFLPGAGAKFGDWGARAQEIIDWSDRIAESNRILLEETGQAALTAEEIAAATAERMRQLADEAVASLGLPLENTRAQFKQLADTLGFLESQVAAGIISQERYGEIIAQVADQQFLALGDALLGFLDRYYGDVAGYEDFRAQLEMTRFHLELANLKLQFQLVEDLGFLTKETIEFIEGTFKWIDENIPEFPLPSAGAGSGSGGGFGGSTSNAVSEAQRDRERAQEAIRDIIRSSMDAYDRELLELTEQFDEYRRVLGNTSDVQRAWNIAFGQLNDRYTSSLRDFLETLRDPALSQEQQFETVRQRFLALAATGDIGRSQELLQLAEQLRDLGADYFGTAGGGFESLLDLIQAQVNAFLGGGSAIAAAGSSSGALSALGLPPAGAGTGPLGIVPSVPGVGAAAASVQAPGVEARLDTLIRKTEEQTDFARRDTRAVAANIGAVADRMKRARYASVALG